jgi:hypothetical protein
MPKRKRRNGLFDFLKPRSTVYHVKHKRVKPSLTSSKIRALGSHRIVKVGDHYEVPSLDRGSWFDTRDEAQRFIREMKKYNPKRRKRNLEVGLPKNQFVNAKVRMKGGKIQVMADEKVLGKAGFKAGAGLSGVSVSGGAKLNPAKTQFVVEWGAGKNFFNTLKSAKKFIGGLRSRGLLYGRYVKIVKMEPDKPSKTVFEKEY